MLIPSSARLLIKLLFPVLTWTLAQPVPAKGGGSIFVEWQTFCIFLRPFLLMLLKRISCTILVNILCRLVGKLLLKSPSFNTILMTFIIISETDCALLLLLLLLFIDISTGTSYQLQLTVFHISPA